MLYYYRKGLGTILNTLDRGLWDKAKLLAKNKHKSDDWVYIFTVYNYLGGKHQTVSFVTESAVLRLVGYYNQNSVIVYNDKTNQLTVIPYQETLKLKKVFSKLKKPVLFNTVDNIFISYGKSENPLFKKNNSIPMYEEEYVK